MEVRVRPLTLAPNQRSGGRSLFSKAGAGGGPGGALDLTTSLLDKGYVGGTHRLIAPEATLKNILPHLAAAQVTRCADVTGLDHLGIPVYCAIRPLGKTVQVTNGKGLRHVDAKVSALMEAIELFHAETPTREFETASFTDLLRAGRNAVKPDVHPDFESNTFFSPDFIINWT